MHSTLEGPRVVGTKQTLKALQDDEVQTLFIAKDANMSLIEEILTFVKSNDINVDYVDSMEQLGRACNIKVKTATAALIKQ